MIKERKKEMIFQKRILSLSWEASLGVKQMYFECHQVTRFYFILYTELEKVQKIPNIYKKIICRKKKINKINVFLNEKWCWGSSESLKHSNLTLY